MTEIARFVLKLWTDIPRTPNVPLLVHHVFYQNYSLQALFCTFVYVFKGIFIVLFRF